ncbi:aminopeptidase P family protein [Baekduia soli]|uniref:Aminopeptidase P family protein n=1 Tax=Baekduia soli TaxID=496014 RepID=A0A5B8U8P6_9ACTN|nr:Xaa-Pro peptidase family protein [Baekduia soli]QEC49370.1 aminopeptidase P family protein [Baekduia soli]
MSMDRPDRLAAALRERDLDALLVTRGVDVGWLTGFTGSSGLAVVGARAEGGLRLFLTDFRYLTQSAEQLDEGWERRITQELLPAAAQALPGPGAGAEAPLRVGFDDAHLPVKDHATLAEGVAEGIELVPAGGILEGLRLVKDPGELERIRAATRLADAAMTEVLGRGLAGRTERDVALDLEFTMRRAGAQSVSFPPIVAAAAHSALPHAEPRDVEIPAGTLVTIDWGAVLDGYASDCTRTYATGELDPRDAEIYALVLRAQESALAAIRPGASGREVDTVARDIITAAGHGEHFGHGLGHGVGVEVHEGPRLSQRSEATLAAGQVVTVEPGVYVPGAVGVRIEDLVIVTDDGCEVLTGLPKDLQTVA